MEDIGEHKEEKTVISNQWCYVETATAKLVVYLLAEFLSVCIRILSYKNWILLYIQFCRLLFSPSES